MTRRRQLRRGRRLFGTSSFVVRHLETRNLRLQLASTALALPLSIIVARALGPHDRGVFALTTMAAAIAAVVAGLGLSDAVPRVLNRHPASGVDGSLARMLVVAALAAAALFGATSHLWLSMIGVSASPSLTLVAALLIATMACWPFVGNVGVAKGDVKLPIEGEAFRNVVYFAACVAAIAMGILTATTAIAALVLSYVVAGTFVLRRARLEWQRPDRREERAARREAVALGWRGVVSWALAYGSGRLDAFMVGAILGPAAAGLYAVAIGIAEFIAIPGTANGSTVLYRVANAHANAAPWGRFLAGRVAASAGLSALGAIVVAATAAFVVPLVLGAQFVGAINPLRLLSVSVVALSSLRLLRQANFALGETHRNWLGDLAAIAITVLGNLLFLRRGGLAAAAAISIVSNATAVTVLAAGLRFGSRARPSVSSPPPLVGELIAHEAAP